MPAARPLCHWKIFGMFSTGRYLGGKKETAPRCSREAVIYVGDDLLSHTLSRAVQSARRGLTSVFGMGTGISPAVRSPASLTWALIAPLGPEAWVARRTWLRRF